MSGAPIFAANWKMHHGPLATRAFVEGFLERVPASTERRLWFFVPAVSIATAAALVEGRDDVLVGAQNVHWERKGAFTGELSVPLVQEAGARGALVGHSERRHLFGETDEQAGRKLSAVVAAGLTAMLCVGETLAEREGGRTEAVVLRQLAGALDHVDAADSGRIMIAYEPVWAIGTGRTATPDDAAQVHFLIRLDLSRRHWPAGVPILYGGSVNRRNVQSLIERPEIDGVLVGGASLEAEGWADLVTGSR